MRVRAGHGFNNGGSAKNGIVAHNKLYNANAAHWFDDIKQVIPPVPFFTRFDHLSPIFTPFFPLFAQVIFEHNTIEPGGAELSWGNNIDNYSGGYCQHVCEWAASLSLRRCLRLTRVVARPCAQHIQKRLGR